MEIIKGLNNQYNKHVKALYKQVFNKQDQETEIIFNSIIDDDESYLMIDEQKNKVVACVAMSKKVVKHHHLKTRIALIRFVLINPEYAQSQNFVIQLIKDASNDYLNKYESVVIFCDQEELYSSFKLITSSTKYEYQYHSDKKINNNLITKPSAFLIKKIQKLKSDNISNVHESLKEINNKIKLFTSLGLSFVANEKAYIWYTNDQVKYVMYHNIADLIELLDFVQPKNSFLLFEKAVSNNNLLKIEANIVTTKIFAESKMLIPNIDIFKI